MKGVHLFSNEAKTELSVTLDALMFEGSFDAATFVEFVSKSPFKEYRLIDDNIKLLGQAFSLAASEDQQDLVEQMIGKKQKTTLIVEVAEDSMSATLKIIASPDVIIPDIEEVMEFVHSKALRVGVSRKRIRDLLQQVIDIEKLTEVSNVIAKGLVPRNGKNSYIKALVPSALERVLRPQSSDGTKVDMRDLGDIICVKPNDAVAIRVPPSSGKPGRTVTGKVRLPAPGELLDIKLGPNTAVSQGDENIILALVAGQPKFENNIMSIDETFTTKGVNVRTGNIKYDGAVIVNGDVAEHMEIVAKGDVTINGFVESSFIRSGGDIIITQGATGKMNDEDCQLVARGSIFVQHAQGIDMIAGKDINVAKQLAYSRAKAKGSLTVGSIDNPMGNLFASTVNCQKTIAAGSIGAISGSALTLDFSEGYNLLIDRLTALSDVLKELTTKNADHEINLSSINFRQVPEALKLKMRELNNVLEAERILLSWLKEALFEMQERKREYELNSRVIANKELFPGVIVKLNNKVWHGKQEYKRSRVTLDDGNWHYEPLV